MELLTIIIPSVEMVTPIFTNYMLIHLAIICIGSCIDIIKEVIF